MNGATSTDRHNRTSVWDILLSTNLTDSELISVVMELECRRLGLDITPIGAHAFLASDEYDRVPFFRTTGPSVSRAWEKLLWNKSATKEFLQRGSLPVPAGRAFERDEAELAAGFAAEMDWCVVVKPNASARGAGFSADIHDEASFRRAFSKTSSSLARRALTLVEERVLGSDLRIFILDGQLLAAATRHGASVLGDGESTICQLVDAENNRRSRNPHFRSRLIRLDRDSDRILAGQHLSLDSIPNAGSRAILRRNSNVSSGGSIADVTDALHHGWSDVARKLAAHFHPLRQFAVDIVTESYASDPMKVPYRILELEADPATTSLHFPLSGPGRNVCGAIVRAHFSSQSMDMFAGQALLPPGEAIDYSRLDGPEVDATEFALLRLAEQRRYRKSGRATELP